jgi:hypothetical protein
MRAMADWRRIQGSIRKARTSKDPATALADLYNSSRDAMVAFELAQFHEKNGSHADAAQWYTTAASRFRRAQWKVKAQEALTRLGVTVPLPEAEAEELEQEPGGKQIRSSHHGMAGASARAEVTEVAEAIAEPDAATQESHIVEVEAAGELDTIPAIAAQTGVDAEKKRRRRGRRGGVRHRKRREAAGAKAPTTGAAPRPSHARPTAPEVIAPLPHESEIAIAAPSEVEPPRPEDRASAHQRGRHGDTRPQRGSRPVKVIAPPPQAPDEAQDATRIGPAAYQERQRRADEARLRTAEPALASRLAKLESQLRRLVASPAHSLEDTIGAPAGPGVFLLSDSDLIDNYYVEACQTLRIGAGNLLRSGRTREGGNIRTLLASYLGIPEPRVAKYLKDHCAVRWLQLDEGAPLLAHFATAVLQPTLNVMEA